jgi:hypothetical protein
LTFLVEKQCTNAIHQVIVRPNQYFPAEEPGSKKPDTGRLDEKNLRIVDDQ